MENAPTLDHKYLTRVGFVQDVDGMFSRAVEGVEIRVFDTDRGFLMVSKRSVPVPLKFNTVTHLSWFIGAFFK